MWSYKSVPHQKTCLLWSNQHLFDCARQSPHVYEFHRLFQTLFRHHDVHDFWQLPVRVIWCSSSSVRFHPFGVHSNGISAIVAFACARTIRPETDPLSLLCPACRDSMVIGLPAVSWDTCKRRPSSHTTDSPAVEHGTPASVAGCLIGTTVLHAAVSTPDVICLHLLSDLTPATWPNGLLL